MNAKVLRADLEEMIYQLKQYRLLTNQFVNNHVSQHDIESFIEKEYIKSTDKHYYDYDYDLFKWIDTEILEMIVDFLKEME